MAAFLAEELLRRNVGESLALGFAKTEPLIEMALRRIALSEDELLGLLGELRFLEVLISIAGNLRSRAEALEAWRGHDRGSRDFVVGSRSLEVKATRGERSIHKIGSLAQIDPRRSDSNEPEEGLHLLSLGFRPESAMSEASPSLTLPAQVDAILQRLRAPDGDSRGGELQGLFLAKVASYGSEVGRGYEHEEMHGWSSYQSRWQHGFLRIYDMTDRNVLVLRRQDVQRCSHVVLDSVSFEINLPDCVSGDLNPHADIFALAKHLVGLDVDN